MKTIDLNGKWALHQKGSDESLPATVPGCVHTDLLTAGKIDDPYYSDNEKRVQWISEKTWSWSREFPVDNEILQSDTVLLRCEGIDTIATIKVNGKKIGDTDNMYRTWEFDVKEILKPGDNSIEVICHTPLPYIKKRQKEHPIPLHHPQNRIPGDNWVRKEPCNFGWDWGPTLVTCGIWRPISIVAFDTARIDSVHILQNHSKRSKDVGLDVIVSLDKASRGKTGCRVEVSRNGKEIVATEIAPNGKNAKVGLTVPDAELWWPKGMGEQPLYDVAVQLFNSNGELLDAETKRIGLRTLNIRQRKDKWGVSFEFLANGKPFFAKGANWIPADTFANRVTPEHYRHLIKSAADCNMNMIRVWGGGIYEFDEFYEICDELGVCVWQDFMFACAAYPTFDEEWMANVEAEFEDNIKRIRHHPSIALWCGNNELEMFVVKDEWTERNMSWEDYSKLFDKMLPRVCKKLDPQRDYWPCSPHSPVGDRANHGNPECGDVHLWAVWHGRQPFEWYRGITPRFCSEFGFQSFPEPKTVYDYTEKKDRNITSPVMELHQRSWIGNTAIMQYMCDWFRLPRDFESTLYLSQILQAMAIKYAVEHWRRHMPQCMGALYWQLNDCWPVASWASIDGPGRWKALQYMARRFFEPIMVSGLEDAAKGTFEIHVTNDTFDTFNGQVNWTITDVEGKTLDSGKKEVKAGASKNSRINTLRLKKQIDEVGPENIMIWLELCDEKGKAVSTNFASFARPKNFYLPDPEIKANVKKGTGNTFLVALDAKKPALWAWVDLKKADAAFSDNFIFMQPDRPVVIEVTPEKTMTITQFKKQLRIQSLVDTYV
ncbi:MAG: beta-mannosidase [Candidatus Sumerlaeia bacterium]